MLRTRTSYNHSSLTKMKHDFLCPSLQSALVPKQQAAPKATPIVHSALKRNDWLLGSSVGQSIDRSIDRSINQSKTWGITIFREETTSALAGFFGGSYILIKWKFEVLVFVEGGKPGEPAARGEPKNKLNQHTALHQNRIQATLAGGALSRLLNPCFPNQSIHPSVLMVLRPSVR